jgi:hypothetical protein
LILQAQFATCYRCTIVAGRRALRPTDHELPGLLHEVLDENGLVDDHVRFGPDPHLAAVAMLTAASRLTASDSRESVTLEPQGGSRGRARRALTSPTTAVWPE